MSNVTIEHLKAAHWQVLFFADGTDPKHIQAYKCREYPRLTKMNVKPKTGGWRTTYAVDDVEILRDGDDEKFLSDIVAALNADG